MGEGHRSASDRGARRRLTAVTTPVVQAKDRGAPLTGGRGAWLALAIAAAAAGCTHWEVERHRGPSRAAIARPLGPAALEPGRGGARCRQPVEIDYEQPYWNQARLAGRRADLAVGLGLIAVGGIVLVTRPYEQEEEATGVPTNGFRRGTPDLQLGILAGLAGALYLTYSYGFLPDKDPPAAEGVRRWSVTRRVDSTDCPGMAEPAIPRAGRTEEEVARALRQLERLRGEGLISEDEYQARRRALR